MLPASFDVQLKRRTLFIASRSITSVVPSSEHHLSFKRAASINRSIVFKLERLSGEEFGGGGCEHHGSVFLRLGRVIPFGR